MQAATTIYFLVWWVLFEYSSFGHFPYCLRVVPRREQACVLTLKSLQGYLSIRHSIKRITDPCPRITTTFILEPDGNFLPCLQSFLVLSEIFWIQMVLPYKLLNFWLCPIRLLHLSKVILVKHYLAVFHNLLTRLDSKGDSPLHSWINRFFPHATNTPLPTVTELLKL